jgi:hypothetical protein
MMVSGLAIKTHKTLHHVETDEVMVCPYLEPRLAASVLRISLIGYILLYRRIRTTDTTICN